MGKRVYCGVSICWLIQESHFFDTNFASLQRLVALRLCEFDLRRTCESLLVPCQINRAKNLLDKQLKKHAFVFNKLYYCSSVWGNTSKKNLDELQKVQNFAALILSGTKKFQ